MLPETTTPVLHTLLGEALRNLTPPIPSDALKLEISAYFGSQVVPDNVEPIQWWIDHSKNSSSSRRLPSVIRPAINVRCERLFSKAGLVYEKLGYKLSKQPVSAVLTLNSLWDLWVSTNLRCSEKCKQDK